MNINQFIQQSGFKVLAMAEFSQCEYSVILYLMNCSVSGLDEIITSESELSTHLGYEEQEISQCIKALADRNMIKIFSKNIKNIESSPNSIRVGFHFNMESWKLSTKTDFNFQEAIIYPFSKNKQSHLEVIAKTILANEQKSRSIQTWKRVLDTFLSYREIDRKHLVENEKYSKILVETHPVDQIIFLLRYFKDRILSLSLLASNWEHFQELYEVETQKIDLIEAKKKHNELDNQLKYNASNWIDNAEKLKLSNQEINVLKLLVRHRYPRRQLFWAYQARSRYVNLHKFFEDNSELMLAITSSGSIVKKQNPKNT